MPSGEQESFCHVDPPVNSEELQKHNKGSMILKCSSASNEPFRLIYTLHSAAPASLHPLPDRSSLIAC